MTMLRRLNAGALTALVLLAGAACSDDNNNPNPTENDFTATLSGASIVPTAVNTTASGTASFTLNDASSTITYTINVTGLTDANAALLYTGSATDMPGTTVAVLLPAPVSGLINGQLASGTLTTTDIGGGETYATLADKIRAGNAFLVVQTTANPTGELRGQLAVAP
jgi:hypothetical protein